MNESADIQQLLQQALAHHGAGDLQAAEQGYRRMLAADPAQADALHYLGVIGLQTGHLDQAIELIGRALEERPDYLDALSNLGNALQAAGRYEQAILNFEKALEFGPDNPQVTANLGNALLQSGRLAEAIEQYRAALALEPHLADTRRHLADTLLRLGRPGEALTELRTAAQQMGNSPQFLVSMGNVLGELGRSDEAIACFEKVLAAHPDLAPVICNLANVLRQNGQLAEATDKYRHALKLAPDYAEGHYDLGVALQDSGNKDEAISAYRRALEIDRHCGKAWRAIAGLSKSSLDEEDLAAIRASLQSPDTTAEVRTHLEFALGKSCEDVGDYAQAIEHVHRGNRLHRASFEYSIEQDRVPFDNLRDVFDESFFDRWAGVGVEDATPIFIVGMPRSGTTLTEQILASHPLVHGGGELRDLARAIAERFPMRDGVDYTAAMGSATVDDFHSIGEKYLQALRSLDPTATHITDKLPNNFLNVGIMRIVFPKARIIHCVRDPRDTCYSIYKNYFSARGHFYAYDMRELGQYYRLYAELMTHWNAALPGAVYELRYEDMVTEQEATTRALLDACGLPWDPACLEFHKTRRPVATISASQVRQPMYTGSVEAWRNVEESLRPLLETLQG